MDQMEMYEVKAVMEYEYYAYKENWEQARLVAYLIAQTNSTKQLKVTDILKFRWDEDEDLTLISNADVDRLKEKALLFEQQFNLGNNGE